MCLKLGGSGRPVVIGYTLALLALIALAMPLRVDAGAFMARPIRVNLSAGATSTTLILDNSDDQPLQVQTQVLSWSQNNGQDVLEETDELIVSPPIFTVPGGGSQLIRIGSLLTNRTSQELSFRLFLQEVPPAPKEGETTIGVALRISLPVFVQPIQKASPQLAWKAHRGPDNAIELSLANSGNAHIQAIECTLNSLSGDLLVESRLASYVLPGQTRTWTFKPKVVWSGPRLNLKVRTDAGEFSTPVEVE